MDSMLKEIAKHVGRPIEVACNLIENILSVPTKNLGDLLGDFVSYWQWNNRLNIAEKAQEKLKKRGLSPCKLPLDFAVPFLRDCGDAEDADLQEWWAEMLCSALKDRQSCHVAFVGILKSLSPADIRFLDTLLRIMHVEKHGRIKAIAAESQLSSENSRMSFNNLYRLGFFSPTGGRLTGFAFDFLKACCPDQQYIGVYMKKQSELPRRVVVD
ncbi:MAG: DUF4393 domain-containing protein [Sedimentisphaerales bacterium]|nr:DUF4393 domain-containing protein [Sedimentisphaerales bacterium]